MDNPAFKTDMEQAMALRRDKKFAEALKLIDPWWQLSPEAFDAWQAWNYGQCLLATGRLNDALNLCREVYPRFREDERIRQLYARCVYRHSFSGDAPAGSYADWRKAIEAIQQLHPQQQAYSPLPRAIFRTIKWLGRQLQPDWPEIERLLGLLQPDLLDLNSYTITDERGKPRELASDREEWYSWKSKACLQQAQWQEAEQVCRKALQEITNWHYSNDIWFKRRLAAALHQLGQTREAQKLLREVLCQKRDWFLLHDLAGYSANSTESLALTAEAALMPGDQQMRVGMYLHMASWLQQQGEDKLAGQHARLSALLRLQQGWGLPTELEAWPDALSNLPEGNALNDEVTQQIRTLRAVWEKWYDAGKPWLEGNIEKLLANGRGGFVKPRGKGNAVYFDIRDWRKKPDIIEPGMPVRYRLADSWDKKKNKPSKKAVDLQALAPVKPNEPEKNH